MAISRLITPRLHGPIFVSTRLLVTWNIILADLYATDLEGAAESWLAEDDGPRPGPGVGQGPADNPEDQIKGIVQRKSTDVESGNSQKAFLSH